jgi:hypothetical protein
MRSPVSTTGHPERMGLEGSELDDTDRTELGGIEAGGTERGPESGVERGASSGGGGRSLRIEH